MAESASAPAPPAARAEHGPPSRPLPAVHRLTLRQRLRRDKVMLLLTLPGLLYFVVFHYVPLLGYVVAFQDYQPYLGYTHSAWVGLHNFSAAFAQPAFWSATRNTVEIALVQMVFYFPVPIALALLLHSVTGDRVRRFVQSVVYLPHFIGWVIIVSIFQQVLGGAGLVPKALAGMGLPRYDMTTDPHAFPWLLTLELIWKDSGWGTIIVLAALLSIDRQLFESAAMDGAGRWRRLWHVTLPGISPVIVLLLILNLGNFLSVGFEQVLLQRDAVGPDAGEVLDTYVYFHGIRDNDWGAAAAVGLVKAAVGTALVLGANKFAHRLGHEGVYRGADR
ncbi:ABC transporter permease [Actinacidiphila yeochonensis]|uniref:ABC transporter permease n=1 Tax=Actinacidiphila yeochonensis TaxID=89050 RepID=UPI000A9F9DE2|nr:ABC transporter permease subunit [Actinacidiphila yeochonensis]